MTLKNIVTKCYSKSPPRSSIVSRRQLFMLMGALCFLASVANAVRSRRSRVKARRPKVQLPRYIAPRASDVAVQQSRAVGLRNATDWMAVPPSKPRRSPVPSEATQELLPMGLWWQKRTHSGNDFNKIRLDLSGVNVNSLAFHARFRELITLAGEEDPKFVEMMEDFLRNIGSGKAKLTDWIGIIYYLERPKCLPLRPVVSVMSMIGSYLQETNPEMGIPLVSKQSGNKRFIDQTLSNGACNRNTTPASLLKLIGGKFEKPQKAADLNNKGSDTDTSEDTMSSLSTMSSGSETSQESTSDSGKGQVAPKITKKECKRKRKVLHKNMDDNRVKMELRIADGKIDMFKWQGGVWTPMGFNKLWLRDVVNPKQWPKQYKSKYRKQYEKFCARYEKLQSQLNTPTERKCRLCNKMVPVGRKMTEHKRSIECTGSKAYRDHQDVKANRAIKERVRRLRELSRERKAAACKKDGKPCGTKTRRSRGKKLPKYRRRSY